MKRFLSILFACAAIGLVVMPADATLIDRSGGMIYDSDLNITWLQDVDSVTAGYPNTLVLDGTGSWMTWTNAMNWADNLVYGGFDDWRLPKTLDPDPSCTDSATGSYNCTGSELGNLYYATLGNSAGLGGFTNSGPFINVNYQYWSSTLTTADPNKAYLFSFYSWFGGGSQQQRTTSLASADLYDPYDGNSIFRAWAVRDGDVAAVPEPGTMMLLGSGIAGLVAFRKRFRL